MWMQLKDPREHVLPRATRKVVTIVCSQTQRSAGIEGEVLFPSGKPQPQQQQSEPTQPTVGSCQRALSPRAYAWNVELPVEFAKPVSVRARIWMSTRSNTESLSGLGLSRWKNNNNSSPWSRRGGDNPRRNQPVLEPQSAPPRVLPLPAREWTNLVDPASSHMLRSRAKPCTSQRKWCNSGSVNGSLHQQSST